MILTCPSCETQYFADDSTIGESGRTVKCDACGHSWFQQPEGAKKSENQAPAHEVYLGKVREQRRRRSRLAALVSWLVTASLFFGLGLASIIFRNDVVKAWPQAGAAYKRVGFDVNRFGLEFSDIERSRTFNDTIPVVTVSGRAVNVARTTIETPAVRIELKDEQGATVVTAYAALDPATLAPGEAGKFVTAIEQAPVESFEIAVSFVPHGDVPATPADEPEGTDEPLVESGDVPVEGTETEEEAPE
jgi:predicted Zn finger-like uncharacterized protein